MAMIEVGFEVYKALTARRATEDTTYSDVIAELLGLPAGSEPGQPEKKDWIYKNARCPHGTEWRAIYKGFPYRADIVDGVLVYDGQPMNSPSEAAHAVTGTSVNGWTFWEYRLPGSSKWRPLVSLR